MNPAQYSHMVAGNSLITGGYESYPWFPEYKDSLNSVSHYWLLNIY